MPSTTANGIILEYETAGDPSDPPLLLVMGLGAQLITWPADFVEGLVDQGFHVIRFDNRDSGKSTWFDGAGMPNLIAALGGTFDAAYLLEDMAADALGLLDALGIKTAHVVGASMGGMIAQTMAIKAPARVRSLVSIMSTTGAADVGQPRPEVLPMLLRPAAASRQDAIDAGVTSWRAIGSPAYTTDEAEARERIAVAYDRAYHPVGTARQLVAILASGDRTAALGGLDVPTLVIHGDADPLVDPSGGRATAAAIPGAQLQVVPGMAHDLPAELCGGLVVSIAAHAHAHDRRLAESESAA